MSFWRSCFCTLQAGVSTQSKSQKRSNSGEMHQAKVDIITHPKTNMAMENTCLNTYSNDSFFHCHVSFLGRSLSALQVSVSTPCPLPVAKSPGKFELQNGWHLSVAYAHAAKMAHQWCVTLQQSRWNVGDLLDKWIAKKVASSWPQDFVKKKNRTSHARESIPGGELNGLLIYCIYIYNYHGSPQPSFLGVITHILEVENLHFFMGFWGPRACCKYKIII